jgi:integron integrase
VQPTTARVASSPKLLDRVRWHLRVKHYSIRTEQAYVDWIRRFILFHGKRHPSEMAEQEIRAFLTHLAVERRVAASTQNQAFAALLFLYQQVLEQRLGFVDSVERVNRPAKLPVVFTPQEARAVLAHLNGDYCLMAELLYGSGLRLMECLRLRVKDVDFGYNRINVRDGKGLRERVALLPQRLQRPLHAQIARVKELHRQDLARGGGRVYLPFALERKYPNAARELIWQYVFPAAKVAVDPRSGEVRRHHVLGKKSPKRRQTRCTRRGHPQTGKLPYLQTQFRHAFA